MKARTTVETSAEQTGMATETDEDLMRRVAADADRAAFAVLFGRYAARIKAFLMRGGAVADLAEDVAQDVMVTVWRRAGSFDPAKASAATWIFTIARNRRIDVLRRETRAEPDPQDPIFAPGAPEEPQRQLANLDRDERVRAALAALTPEQVAVVRLAFFTGLSHSAIADEIGAPLGTVKSRLRLAFVRLRDELGADFATELIDD